MSQVSWLSFLRRELDSSLTIVNISRRKAQVSGVIVDIIRIMWLVKLGVPGLSTD